MYQSSHVLYCFSGERFPRQESNIGQLQYTTCLGGQRPTRLTLGSSTSPIPAWPPPSAAIPTTPSSGIRSIQPCSVTHSSR